MRIFEYPIKSVFLPIKSADLRFQILIILSVLDVGCHIFQLQFLLILM